jgi:hypothetical protein
VSAPPRQPRASGRLAVSEAWRSYRGAPEPGTASCSLDDVPEPGTHSVSLEGFPVLLVRTV